MEPHINYLMVPDADESASRRRSAPEPTPTRSTRPRSVNLRSSNRIRESGESASRRRSAPEPTSGEGVAAGTSGPRSLSKSGNVPTRIFIPVINRSNTSLKTNVVSKEFASLPATSDCHVAAPEVGPGKTPHDADGSHPLTTRASGNNANGVMQMDLFSLASRPTRSTLSLVATTTTGTTTTPETTTTTPSFPSSSSNPLRQQLPAQNIGAQNVVSSLISREGAPSHLLPASPTATPPLRHAQPSTPARRRKVSDVTTPTLVTCPLLASQSAPGVVLEQPHLNGQKPPAYLAVTLSKPDTDTEFQKISSSRVASPDLLRVTLPRPRVKSRDPNPHSRSRAAPLPNGASVPLPSDVTQVCLTSRGAAVSAPLPPADSRQASDAELETVREALLLLEPEVKSNGPRRTDHVTYHVTNHVTDPVTDPCTVPLLAAHDAQASPTTTTTTSAAWALIDDDDSDGDGAKMLSQGETRIMASAMLPENDSENLTEALQGLRTSVRHNTEAVTFLLDHSDEFWDSPVVKRKGKPSGMTAVRPRRLDREPRDCVTVHCRIVFLKIGEIETIKERYNGEAFIQLKWREPELDYITDQELQHINWELLWQPEINIENVLGDNQGSKWQQGILNEDGHCWIVEKRKVKGVFAETLELQDFPFDVQDLTITLSTERTENQVKLMQDPRDRSVLIQQPFVQQQEWNLFDHVETNVLRTSAVIHYTAAGHWEVTPYISGKHSSLYHSAFSVTCRAGRRTGFFYWNIFLIMSFISCLSFATFSVQPTYVHNRLQLSFTLLLTSVAFKFVVNQSLPKISYLTYLDKYVLVAITFLCLICLWHSFIRSVEYRNAPLAAKVETYAFFAFVGGYLLYQGGFAMRIYSCACERRRIMTAKDRDYHLTNYDDIPAPRAVTSKTLFTKSL